MDTDTTTASHSDPDDASVVGLRLYTRAQITPAWLSRSAVADAMRALKEVQGASIAYLRKGWLHGPHIEIVGRADRDRPLQWHALAEMVRPAAPEPSTVLTEEAYLARAREFGRLEQVPPPYLPMREHGAIEWLRAQDVALWPQPLDALREAVLTKLAEPLMATLTDLCADRSDATVRLGEAFAALAGTHRAGAEYGAFSLHSHAEAFLTWAGHRTDARPAFEQRLRAEAPMLRPVVERALAGRPTPTAAAWDGAIAYSMGIFEAAVLCDALSLTILESLTGEFDPTTMGPPGASGPVVGVSTFHRTTRASGVIDDPPEWFAAYRTVVNLFYQQLPLLGVAPMQRYYLCYAIANLIDEVTGESWHDRLERLRALQRGPEGAS